MPRSKVSRSGAPLVPVAPAEPVVPSRRVPERFRRPSRRVLIRLANFPVRPCEEDFARAGDALRGMAARAEVPIERAGRVFHAIAPDELADFVERASARRGRAPNLNGWFRVTLQSSDDTARFVRACRGEADIERVSVEFPSGPATETDWSLVTTNLSAKQRYRWRAPIGVGATLVAKALGADGAGVSFADVEPMWFVDSLTGANLHPDLPAVTCKAERLSGVTHSHGTSSIGVVAARPDALGCTGIAPNVDLVYLAGTRDMDADGDIYEDVHDAVVLATTAVGATGVVLIEVESYVSSGASTLAVPVEQDDAVFDAIVCATAIGTIVVAAAGNGGLDLATVEIGTGNFYFDPAHATYRDSEATLVGAGVRKAGTWKRVSTSNHGARVTSFAAGSGVVTTSCVFDALTATRKASVRDDFADTSAAAAIVAGAAVAAQGMAMVGTGGARTSAEMRDILGANGTNAALNQKIGTMPDLVKIKAAVA